jgi:spore maturation protein CgeB
VTPPLRILLGHLGWSEDAVRYHRAIAERARSYGVQIETICLVPEPPAPRMSFDELDLRWRRRDPALVRLREKLIEAARGADVFWNFNGANVHPAWLPHLGTFNVYGCFDDPESSDQLSAPVARYFDAALVGNLACLPLYRGWGLRRVAWAPNAFIAEDSVAGLTPEIVRSEERPIEVVFFGERESGWRRERLERLAKAFPDAVFHGRGWSSGYVSDSERRRMYRNAKIGWNLHNSVGPVNIRTFVLPAAGVLQIGDNKCRLGEVFRLGEEVVGFDSVGDSMDECIELTRYYLAHDAERRRIAANGLARFTRDYTEPRLWDYFQQRFGEWIDAWRKEGPTAPQWQPSARASLIRRVARRGNRALARVGLQIVRTRPAVPVERRESDAPESRTVALAWAVASLVGDATRIADLGTDGGRFAVEAAADPDRTIVSSHPGRVSVEASRGNVAFLDRRVAAADGPFDLAVGVDVLDQREDFRSFLQGCAELAPRLLVTTGAPSGARRAREWTAGELYWVLRCFYARVDLYALPDPLVPSVVAVDVNTTLSPLIASCGDPLR